MIAIDPTEAVGGWVLAKYMKQFREKYPKVPFDLHNEMADNIKDELEKSLLDLGLLLEPVISSNGVFVYSNDPFP